MTTKQFQFWQKWLTYANVMTIIVGLLVAFAGNSKIFELHGDTGRHATGGLRDRHGELPARQETRPMAAHRHQIGLRQDGEHVVTA